MRTAIHCVIIPCAYAAAALALGLFLGQAKQSPAKDDAPARFDKVEAKEIVLVSEDGRAELRLSAGKDLAGLRLKTAGRDPYLTLLAGQGKAPWLGFNGGQGGRHAYGLLIQAGDDGAPVMVLRKGKQARVLTLDDIFRYGLPQVEEYSPRREK